MCTCMQRTSSMCMCSLGVSPLSSSFAPHPPTQRLTLCETQHSRAIGRLLCLMSTGPTPQSNRQTPLPWCPQDQHHKTTAIRQTPLPWCPLAQHHSAIGRFLCHGVHKTNTTRQQQLRAQGDPRGLSPEVVSLPRERSPQPFRTPSEVLTLAPQQAHGSTI